VTGNLDRIEIRGIRAWGRHGANPGEQDVPQPLDIDLTIELDLTHARATDALNDTVSYADMHARVVRTVARECCALLERLGELILDAVMSDTRIARAHVSIAKPRLLAGATPVVTLHRER
jgi:dihydroneopterin aldolase